MSRIKIPKTLEGVTGELGGISALLTATEWRRAALLAAVVRLTGKPGPRDSGEPRYLSAKDFSQLGIVGLRDDKTIRRYVQHWLDANDGEYPELGATVTLPDKPWPPEGRDTIDRSGPGTVVKDLVEGIKEGRVPDALIDEMATAIVEEKPDAVVEAVGKLPRTKRAKIESDIIDSAVDNIGAPFDTPPPIEGEDRPLRSGYAITEACDEFTRSAHKLIQAMSRYQPLEDPVADRAMDQTLDLIDTLAASIRERLGVEEVAPA